VLAPSSDREYQANSANENGLGFRNIYCPKAIFYLSVFTP